MRIGVPKEIKNHEYRVGLIPSSVLELVHHGHEVVVQEGAGLGAGLSDADYIAAGASILATADEIFALLRSFNQEQRCACLIVTHDPRLAARSDRVIRLVDGHLAPVA